MWRRLEGHGRDISTKRLRQESKSPRWPQGGRSRAFRLDVNMIIIRENPASRGTEASAEVLVGPPWRMESNAGPQQWY